MSECDSDSAVALELVTAVPDNKRKNEDAGRENVDWTCSWAGQRQNQGAHANLFKK